MKNPDPIPRGAVSILLARHCANDKLRVIAEGDGAWMKIFNKFANYNPPEAREQFLEKYVINTAPMANATMPVTKAGYWFRKNILGYQEVRAA